MAQKIYEMDRFAITLGMYWLTYKNIYLLFTIIKRV